MSKSEPEAHPHKRGHAHTETTPGQRPRQEIRAELVQLDARLVTLRKRQGALEAAAENAQRLAEQAKTDTADLEAKIAALEAS